MSALPNLQQTEPTFADRLATYADKIQAVNFAGIVEKTPLQAAPLLSKKWNVQFC